MTGASDLWGQGTSAVGYLESAESTDSLSVPVVRLEDEPYTHFDFLKFDLQGGEKAALLGLGEKAKNAKLMYVEQQLLGAPEAPDSMPLSILSELGFISFYDRVQFGFDTSRGDIPLKLLASGGIDVKSIRMADGRGLPMCLRGELQFNSKLRMSSDGAFDDDYITDLKKAGISWMATDIIAINSEIFPKVMLLI